MKDALSKEKVIKSTLELMLYTNSGRHFDSDEVEASDWFLVSQVSKDKDKTLIYGKISKLMEKILKFIKQLLINVQDVGNLQQMLKNHFVKDVKK